MIGNPFFIKLLQFNGIGCSFNFLNQNRVTGPAFLCVSIINSEGMRGHRGFEDMEDLVEINTSDLICELVFVENLQGEAAAEMKRPLDTIWNGFGAERCTSYDDNGNWQPSRN